MDNSDFDPSVYKPLPYFYIGMILLYIGATIAWILHLFVHRSVNRYFIYFFRKRFIYIMLF